MKEGTRIYYTGDSANHPGYGFIIGVKEPTEYSSLRYDILMDDGREFPAVYEVSFTSRSGCRFWIADEYRAHRQKMTDKAAEIIRKGA